LHYNWHRFYDPETGRYISADPIGLAGGINLYAYVCNDPVNFVDPWGLCVWDACIGEGAYVGLAAGTAAAGWLASPQGQEALGKAFGWMMNEGDGECGQDHLPSGSKPIDKTPWSGDHGEIKDGIGNGPADDTWISPDDHVWNQNPDGTYNDHGNAGDYTGSGKPSGNKGKNRKKPWR